MNDFVDIPEPSRFRIGALFQENNFLVPVYQRNYSWTNDEISDFWNDLNDVIDGLRTNHFFGQIVTFKNDEKVQEIIDGQQRITTSALFLAALRDIANEMYRQKRSNLTEDAGDNLRDVRKTVSKLLRGENGNRAALIVEQSNLPTDKTKIQDFFNRLTNGHESSVNDIHGLNEPMRNLLSAYRSIRKSIENKIKMQRSLIDRVNMIERICDSFVEHFYVVMISAPNQQDAFIIFETLNSRGKDLKASDIIKNHLMYLMSNNLLEANDDWNKIATTLNDKSSRITRFIRTYWAAKSKLVSEKVLYRSLSDELKTETDARYFLKDLIEIAPLYDVLERPTYSNKNKTYFVYELLNQQINVLSKLHALVYYPIVIAMRKRKYSENDIAIIVNKVIPIFIRHRTIMNEGTNKLETGFSEIARKIYDDSLHGVIEITKEMEVKLLKSNSELEAKLQVLAKEGGQKGQKKWTLIYLLSKIYDDQFNDIDYYKETFIEDNFVTVQLANIKEGPEDLSGYLGNWTIIENNRSFSPDDKLDDRINSLKSSRLNCNKELAKKLANEWSREIILERQKRMSDVILQLW